MYMTIFTYCIQGKYLPSLMFARFAPIISGYKGNPGNSRTESYKEYKIRITSRFKHPLESSKERVTKFRMKFVQMKKKKSGITRCPELPGPKGKNNTSGENNSGYSILPRYV